MASNWSGQVDFLSDEFNVMLPGKLEKIPQSAVWKDILIPESEWFVVDEGTTYKAFNYVFENYEEVKRKAKNVKNINREKFTLNEMTKKLKNVLDKYIKKTSSQAVGLKLPKLKLVGDKKENKIKLPKLKKV